VSDEFVEPPESIDDEERARIVIWIRSIPQKTIEDWGMNAATEIANWLAREW
jgi:hypothetical protein